MVLLSITDLLESTDFDLKTLKQLAKKSFQFVNTS
jgi:hypothetical protein